MVLFRKISRRKLITLIAMALVVIAASITGPLVFLRSSGSLVYRDVMCSPIGNAIIEAMALYTQYGSFGNAEFIVHQINANESVCFPGIYLARVARCPDDHFTCNN
jgi:general stress protein CsbA